MEYTLKLHVHSLVIMFLSTYNFNSIVYHLFVYQVNWVLISKSLSSILTNLALSNFVLYLFVSWMPIAEWFWCRISKTRQKKKKLSKYSNCETFGWFGSVVHKSQITVF